MSPALLWFRRDLRLADNPAPQALIDSGHSPLPVYIHDESDAEWKIGAASSWWLHHSLIAPQQSQQKHGSNLLVFQGKPFMPDASPTPYSELRSISSRGCGFMYT